MKTSRIRFDGFSDEWVEKKLGELLKERKATQPQSNDAPLVSFTVEKGVTPKTDRYDREGLVTGDRDAKRYKLTLLNDIVYNPANLKFGAISRNKFGKAVFSPIYITYSQKTNNLDMRFIEMIVTSDSFIKRARKYEQGTVYERQSVSSSDMLKTVVQLPSLPEQQKIGSLFSKYDAIIALREQKLEELNALKKGMLQQMFDDSVTTNHKPQVRFSGFNDEWEEKKFKNIATLSRGLTYKPSSVSMSGVRVLRSSNVFEDRFVLKNDDVFVVSDAVNIHPIKNGDILITSANGSNRLVGKHAIVKGLHEKAVHGGFMLKAETDTPEFVNALMNSEWYSEFISKFVSGGNGAIGNLKKNDLDNQLIQLPSLPEQQKIGQLFKQIDVRISNEQAKIERLKAQKQGLLQRML